MIRLAAACLGFAAVSFACACGPPGAGPFSGELAPDATLCTVDAGGPDTNHRRRGPGAVCVHNDECRSGNCEKLFVCEKDRAVSCNRDHNDCPANGLPGSACVEERTGTCSPSPSPVTSCDFDRSPGHPSAGPGA